MSRANIGEAYYRLKYNSHDSCSPSEDLKEELIRLRESTRKALEQSWDEMGSLRRQCAISAEMVAQQNGALTKIEEKKKAWQLRCLSAEAKLQAITQTQQRDTLHYPKRLSLTQSIRRSLKAPVNNDKDDFKNWPKRLSLTQSIRRSLTAPVNNDKDDSKDAIDLELVLKLSSRDKAISSLEHALDENTKYMNTMKLDMRNLKEKQRIEEENIKESYALREKQLEELVDSLQKELSRTRSVSKNVDLLQKELLKTRCISKNFDSLEKELCTNDNMSKNETKICQ